HPRRNRFRPRHRRVARRGRGGEQAEAAGQCDARHYALPTTPELHCPRLRARPLGGPHREVWRQGTRPRTRRKRIRLADQAPARQRLTPQPTRDMTATQTQTADAAKQVDPILRAFERFEQAGASRQPGWLFPMRKAGIARFAELGFPTLKHEDWRFTNVAPIAKLPFKPAFESTRDGLTRDSLTHFPFAKLSGTRLVFVNGFYAAEFSIVPAQQPGIKVGSLAAALASDSTL